MKRFFKAFGAWYDGNLVIGLDWISNSYRKVSSVTQMIPLIIGLCIAIPVAISVAIVISPIVILGAILRLFGAKHVRENHL